MKKLFAALLFTLSLNLFAANDIEIQDPKIRLTPPGTNVTAMFLKIVNHTDKDLKMVKVSGDLAETFELHSMEMLDGKMKMRRVDFIELKKKSTTELKSGGLHIMIFDVLKPLKEGDLHKIKFTLDNKAEIEINAKVEKFN
ncbi:MAG: copper chaperone PCu(A)C [Bacteriovorax sp.]